MAITVRQPPTRRQVEVLRAYIGTGSITAAAIQLEIAESTVRQHLSGLYRRTGCVNAAQAAYLLGVGDRATRDQGLLQPERVLATTVKPLIS